MTSERRETCQRSKRRRIAKEDKITRENERALYGEEEKASERTHQRTEGHRSAAALTHAEAGVCKVSISTYIDLGCMATWKREARGEESEARRA